MSIYLNIPLAFVQNTSINLGNALSENPKKFIKIATVALAILGAVVVAYYVFKRCYQAKNLTGIDIDPIVPTPHPKPIPASQFNPQPNPPVVKTPEPKKKT